MKRLIEIQNKLKCLKNNYNDFGHYHYRSCEDIIEAVKPLLKEQDLALVIKDSLVQVWERYYIEALVELYDSEWKMITYSTWYAREEETKKWMDWSQITGSSSSYARKYALAGLFLLDSNDWIDSDTTNKWEEKKEEKKSSTITFNQNDLPWFNKEELEQLKSNEEWVKWFDNSDSLLSSISTKYKISKEMKTKIADYRASL